METNNSKPQKTTLIILALLLIGSLYYGFKMKNENAELATIFEQQKEDYSEDLNEMITDFDEAIADNSTLSSSLEESKLKVTQLRDSVKGLKSYSYRTMRKYKKQIAAYQADSRVLLRKVDSLSVANATLTTENTSLSASLFSEAQKNVTLEEHNTSITKKNNELSKEVLKGAQLKVNTIDVIPMKERNSGKVRKTDRAKKTDAFRVSFDVTENPLATIGPRKAYILVQDSNGNVMSPKGVTKLGNKEVGYSDAISFNYQKENLILLSLVEVNRDVMNKGTYAINIYIDGRHVGKSSVTLK